MLSKQVRIRNLNQALEAEGRSLAQVKLPSDKSGSLTKNLELREMLAIKQAQNEITKKSDWNDKQDIYNDQLLEAFAVIKERFAQSSQKIIREASKSNTLEFEKVTRQYYEALTILQQCQLHLTATVETKGTFQRKIKIEDRLSFLEKQAEALQTEVESFKQKVQEVASKLVEKQVKAPQKGVIVNFANSISQIDAQYKKAYDTAYGESGHGISSFRRWLKNIFQKSDRAQEIAFLNAISTNKDSNELICAQAAALVHNKILASEWFGKGSLLRELLGNLLQGTPQDKSGTHKTLAKFLDDHEDIKNAMPKNLKEYFEKNQPKYQEEIIHTLEI